MAQDADKWQAVRFAYKTRNFFKAEEVLASQDRTLLHGQTNLVSSLFVCLFVWLVDCLVSVFVSRDLYVINVRISPSYSFAYSP